MYVYKYIYAHKYVSCIYFCEFLMLLGNEIIFLNYEICFIISVIEY